MYVYIYGIFQLATLTPFRITTYPRKPHVGFPEMAKHEYAKQILAAGFKVVVVEQVERVVETNQRKSEEKNTGDAVEFSGKFWDG